LKDGDMDKPIDAIFLDVGNTLRIVVEDPAFMAQAKKDLMDLVGATEPEQGFFEGLENRWKAYRQQAKRTLFEASEKELWTKWLLPAYPEEMIASLSGRLTRLWRDHDGRRIPRPDVKETVLELHRRGYALGIIANTITETEIPDWVEADGLTECFREIVLSSRVGVRKPNPEIYWEAARRVGVEPSKCAYVGDNPARDVAGAQAAGYGMMILFMEPATLAKERPPVDVKPDCTIREMKELLDIFPARS
jgi:HAD superfamily hydrolase (TIGR01509 family)